MNHHFRSFSEQQQPTAQVIQTSELLGQTNSIIRIHTDSQQSLDRLFNPVQATVPLKDRQLPKSFFDPTYNRQTADRLQQQQQQLQQQQQHQQQHQAPASFHSRSVSYGQAPRAAARLGLANGNSMHVRTSSTLAPMPVLASSNQSSHENLAAAAAGATNGSNGNAVGPANTTTTATTTTTNTAWPTGLSLNPMATANHHPMPNQYQQHTQLIPNVAGLANHPAPMQQYHAASHQLAGHPQHAFFPSTGPIQPQQATLIASSQHQFDLNTGAAAAGQQQIVHSRSMSFDQSHHQQGAPRLDHQQSMHTRTHSTLMPMSRLGSVDNSISSNQSSHELLNHTADGFSSSGYSTDDMTATPAGWQVVSQPAQAHQVLGSEQARQAQQLQQAAPTTMAQQTQPRQQQQQQQLFL